MPIVLISTTGDALPDLNCSNNLHGFGVSISAGELDALLIIDKEIFHEEKAAVFETGKALSDYLNTDDTGARHDGKNGYCTHVGSPFFSYFESTFSKSRINFLEILRGRYLDYILSEDALMPVCFLVSI